MSEEITPEVITQRLQQQGLIEESQDAKEMPKEEVEAVETEAEEVLEPSEEVVEEPKEEYTEAEQEALTKGWKPEGEKSAEEFLRAEPLYEEIKQRGKEIKSLKSQLDEIMKHVGNLKRAGYEEKLEVIQAEREDAVARSDLESLNYLDEELAKVKSELDEEVPTQTQHPATVEFLDKYQDIIQDYSLESQRIKEFLSERDVQLASYNLDPETHMKTLEKDMKSQFPEKFQEKQVKQTVSAVESDSRPITKNKKSKYTFSDLNRDQKNVYKYMERKGVMTGAEYIQQLVDIGQLK